MGEEATDVPRALFKKNTKKDWLILTKKGEWPNKKRARLDVWCLIS